MNLLTSYVTLIFIIKIIFIYFAIRTLILSERKNNKDDKTNKEDEIDKEYNTNKYFKERFELLFKLLMSFFLIFVFYPHRKKPIALNFESRLLLCLFGVILLLSAKWKEILDTSYINNILHAFSLT